MIAENITDMVPVTNPFLKEMLQTFLHVGGRKGGINSTNWAYRMWWSFCAETKPTYPQFCATLATAAAAKTR